MTRAAVDGATRGCTHADMPPPASTWSVAAGPPPLVLRRPPKVDGAMRPRRHAATRLYLAGGRQSTTSSPTRLRLPLHDRRPVVADPTRLLLPSSTPDPPVTTLLHHQLPVILFV